MRSTSGLMRHAVFKSLLVGFLGATLLGVIAIFLGGVAGPVGKLICAAYMLPGLAFGRPFEAIIELFFMGLFPEGGAGPAFLSVLPYIVVFWTLLLGALYLWRGSRSHTKYALWLAGAGLLTALTGAVWLAFENLKT